MKRSAEAFVYTFKEGILSAVAHDLKIRVERLELDADDSKVSAWFDATSLRVVTTRKDGADSAGLLPTVMYGEIEKNIRNDVLESDKFARITFESTEVGATEVRGKLTLCGVTRDIRCARQGDRVEHRLDVRDYGVKPYTAMLGTLKVKPEVVVEIRLLP
jgi:polyisoprenoid-binding protein YceI